MTCVDFVYSPSGRRGIGVNQPQSGLHYPFVLPDASIRHLIADFYLAYEESNVKYQHPLKISWIYGLGCVPNSRPAGAPQETHPVDILVTDANGQVVFDSTLAENFSTWGWGERHPHADSETVYDYQIYQWLSEKHVCRLVAYNTWVAPEAAAVDEDVARNYALHISPAAGTLDERSVYKMPKRVTSIAVRNGAGVSAKLAGELVFEYGYNTTFDVVPQQRRGVRATNNITLNVEPGAGRGKYFDCPETPTDVIYSINGITGPDILISALDCLWTTVPTTSTTSGGVTTLTPTKPANAANILLASNCPACCGCNDYVLVGNYMNRTADRYRPIGEAVDGIVQQHADNISRWLSQTNCRLQRPLQIDVTPQRCPVLDVVAQYCNQCDKCALNVKFKIKVKTFRLTAGGGSSAFFNQAFIVCGRTNITTPFGGTRLQQINPPEIEGTGDNRVQIITVELGKVDIGNAGKVDFRLRFAAAVPTAIQLELTATTSPDNRPENETPIKSECGDGPALVVVLNTALRCNEDGTTNLSC